MNKGDEIIKEHILPISIFLLVTLTTIIIEAKLIPALKGRANQPIYNEGPSWHISKKGTPTMGGLAFVISSTILLLIAAIIQSNKSEQSSLSILISLIFCLANAFIGIIDDITKLKRHENSGLTPKQKLLFQSIIAIIFIMARRHFLFDTTSTQLSFFNVDLGFFYYPAALFLILGIVNCANLTDGIDGLASNTAIAVGIAFLLIFYEIEDSSVLSCALIGSGLGFLLFNANPAKIFMGDTGSLYLGALAVSTAFATGQSLNIIFVGIVYVIEGVSVILQVCVYKATGKRIFKMAPLHHHLEKSGFSETQICAISFTTTLIFSALLKLIL